MTINTRRSPDAHERADDSPRRSRCHFCGCRLYYTPGREPGWGWVKGDAFGVKGMIQACHDCQRAESAKARGDNAQDSD